MSAGRQRKIIGPPRLRTPLPIAPRTPPTGGDVGAGNRVDGTTSWAGYETSEGVQSLRMWHRYFPNGHILGVDIHHKAVAGPRIAFEQGDQAGPEFLAIIMAGMRLLHKARGSWLPCVRGGVKTSRYGSELLVV
jgi:hypothetical protein